MDRTPVYTEDERQSAARQAYKTFCANVSVFLLYGKAMQLGSGITFRTASGEPFVLTARHVAEELNGTFRLGRAVSGGNAGRATAADVKFGPRRPAGLQGDGREPDVDVAIVRFPRAVWALLPEASCGVDQVAGDELIEKTDVIMLSGFPAFLAFSPPRTPTDFLITHIAYTTGVTGRDQYGRMCTNWGDALADPGTAPHPKFELSSTAPRRLDAPGGISGSGLWRVRGTADTQAIWATSRHTQLLGVPCAWDMKETQFVEPVTLWADWFRGAANDIS